MKDVLNSKVRYFPVLLQNVGVSLYNSYLYHGRHKGGYKYYRKYYEEAENMSAHEIQNEAERRLGEFIDYATEKSEWYAKYKGKRLSDFPPLEKHDLVNKLDKIATIKEGESIVSLTGGTTGASLKVLYRPDDMQERFAILDNFRSAYGYQLGKNTAWFSGKGLVSNKDIESGSCFRDDYINKIRFFSTFHINRKNFEIYWKAFKVFSPEYIVGFPSSVYDLCSMALEKGLEYKGVVKAFFPTAETVLAQHRDVIGKVLGCPLIDQYASSEGAPFITQCKAGSLHINPLTGVFEVVDKNMQPAEKGELLVTSFTTHGTPLIRYRIGDSLELEEKSYICPCGSSFPVVKRIDGRTSDYIWSPTNGRVNLGNISNCTKDVEGIICFQVVQEVENKVFVKVVSTSLFNKFQKQKFKNSLQQRLGEIMEVEIITVDSIPRERSGKFRIVKNTLA